MGLIASSSILIDRRGGSPKDDIVCLSGLKLDCEGQGRCMQPVCVRPVLNDWPYELLVSGERAVTKGEESRIVPGGCQLSL